MEEAALTAGGLSCFVVKFIYHIEPSLYRVKIRPSPSGGVWGIKKLSLLRPTIAVKIEFT